MRPKRLWTVRFLGFLVLAGCDGRVPDAGHVVRDSLGITIIENSSPLWETGSGWTIAESPIIDIGSESGPVQFFDIAAAFTIPGNRIAVLNSGSQELQLFDWLGTRLQTSGGAGGGPGEFQRAGSAFLYGNQIVVYDGLGGRISQFDLEGQFVDSKPVVLTEELPLPLFSYRLTGGGEGGGYLLVKDSGRGDTRATEPVILWDSSATYLVDESGSVVGEIGEPWGMTIYSAPGVFGFPRWGVAASLVVHGSELYVGDGREYEVRVYEEGQRLSRIIRRTVPRMSGAEADERLLTWLRSQPETQSLPSEAVTELEASIVDRPRLERLPVYQRFLVDRLGYLWVEQYRPSDRGRVGLWVEGLPRWDVFDADGRLLGEVEVPSDFNVMEIGSDFVLGVWTDSLRVEHVRVYSLIRGA